MSRKGIILAGGAGTRLHPLTMVMSKQLLPVYDKPMIYYPLSALMLADIREILIITTPETQAAFKHLLGTGKQWGIKLEYAEQAVPNGLAQAFVIGADFVRGHRSCLILGDNILYGHGLPEALRRAGSRTQGSTIFSYWVEDPQRYGVIEFGAGDEVLSIDEKPQNPKSNWAAIGVYFYDEQVIDLVKELKPSARGELEITDLNVLYMRAAPAQRRTAGARVCVVRCRNSRFAVGSRRIRACPAAPPRTACLLAGRDRLSQRLDRRRTTEGPRREGGQDALLAASSG